MPFRSEGEQIREQVRRLEEQAGELEEEKGELERQWAAERRPHKWLAGVSAAVLVAGVAGYGFGALRTSSDATQIVAMRETERRLALEQELAARAECVRKTSVAAENLSACVQGLRMRRDRSRIPLPRPKGSP